MKKILLSITLLISSLFSETPLDQELPITDVEKGLPIVAAGCVNVISGDYIEQDLDLFLRGPVPLSYERFYSSADYKTRSLFCGWRHSHDAHIKVIEGSKNSLAHSCDLMGRSAQYEGKKQFKYKKDKSITNCSSGMLSSRTNIKNTSLAKDDRLITSNLANGDKHEFSYYKKEIYELDPHYNPSVKDQIIDALLDRQTDVRFYRITQQNLLNGGQIHYEYDKNHDLKKICSTDSTGSITYGALEFQLDMLDNDIGRYRVSGSDGSFVEYHIGRFNNRTRDEKYRGIERRYHVINASSSNGPVVHYRYRESIKDHESVIRSRILPEGRFLKISYYDWEQDKRSGRVHYLRSPAGTTGDAQVTYTFDYNLKNRYTDVFDAYGNQTRYEYDHHKRLTHVSKYGKKEIIQDQYVWDHDGQLICHHVKNNSNVLASRCFEYDHFGNITDEKLCGSITGLKSLIGLGEHDMRLNLQSVDCYTKKYTYTNDLHLLQTESDDTGFRTEYCYLPGTDRILAKYLYDQDQIIIRYFFDYHPQFGTLQKTIKDNGCTKEREDLTRVTERSIEEITPNGCTPYGLPHVIENKFLNLATGQEELLKKTVIHYSDQGNVLQKDIYDREGSKRYSLSWEYGAHGNVIGETNALGQMTLREYDANDNLVKETWPDRSYHKEYEYDFSNRLIAEKVITAKDLFVTGYSYDFLGNRTAIRDINGNSTHCQYDSLGHLEKVIYPKIPDKEGCLIQTEESFSYDTFNKVKSHSDCLGLKTLKKNNIFGNPLLTTYPDRSYEKYTYTIKGKPLRFRARNGHVTHYRYDVLGRLIEDGEKTYCYNAFHLLSETDPEGNTTEYEYDDAGRLISEKKNERLKTYEYDLLGNQSVIKEWVDETSYLAIYKEFDLLGRIICEETRDDNETLFTWIKYEYDAEGNITLVNEGGHVTKTEFDFQKRPVKIEDAMGNCTHFAYHYGVCDDFGMPVLKVVTTEASGYQTIVHKNALNHEARVERCDPFGECLSKKEMFYNGKGDCLRVKEAVYFEGVLEREWVVDWEYENGNLTKLIEGAGSADQRIISYRYNKVGEKVEMIQPNGARLSYAYDSKGRLSLMSSEDFEYSYTYNCRDLPLRVTNLRDGTFVERTYDDAGQITLEKLSTGYVLTYEYDRRGRLTAYGLPGGSYVKYVYDAFVLRGIEHGEKYYSGFEYDQCGRLVKMGEIRYYYDKLSRPLEISHPVWSQKVDGYDLSGNLMGEYAYDGLNQLTKEEDHAYVYDSLCNRRKKDGISYVVNDCNQVMHDGEREYRYDFNGNLLEDGENCYVYDALNRLTKVVKGGKEVEYRYDAFNRRVSKGELNFLYLLMSEVGSVDVKSGEMRDFRVLRDFTEIGTTVAIEVGNRNYLPLQDIHGNIVRLLDEDTGECVEEYAYTAFGEEKGGMYTSPWRYSGKRVDEETGFVYFGERYYVPRLGRFLNRDPGGFLDGLNAYAYVRNNPLIYVDQRGLFLSGVWQICTAVASVLLNTVGVALSVDTGTGESHVAPFTGPVPLFGPPRELSTATADVSAMNQEDGPGIICFTNGVMNDDEEFYKNIEYIKQMSGNVPVVGVHHRTCFSEGILDDFLRYFTYRFSGKLSEASKKMLSTWVGYCTENPGKKVLQICHSEGAVHVRNALRACPPEVRERIEVVVIAGGAYINDRNAGSVVHYCSSRDIVPHLDFIGRRMARSQGTLEVLQPARRASLFDHSFRSVTFKNTLEKHINIFRGNYV